MGNRLARGAARFQVVPIPGIAAVSKWNLVVHQRSRSDFSLPQTTLTQRIRLPLSFTEFCPSPAAVNLLLRLIRSRLPIGSVGLLAVFVTVTDLTIYERRATDMPARGSQLGRHSWPALLRQAIRYASCSTSTPSHKAPHQSEWINALAS